MPVRDSREQARTQARGNCDMARFASISRASAGGYAAFVMSIRALLRLSCLLAALSCVPVARSAGLPRLISFEPDGTQIATDLQHAIASPTGKFVLTLVSSTNGGAERRCFRWYLRDLDSGTTEIISRKANGADVDCDHVVFSGTSADIDASGRFVVFDQYGGGIDPAALPLGRRVYLRDRESGSVRLFGPPPSQRASHPTIDDAGRRVSMLTGDTSNRVTVYDRATGLTVASVDARSPSEPAISGDGRKVVFTALPEGSIFTVRGQIYLLHVDEQRVEVLSAAADGTLGNDASLNPAINFDGTWVAFDTDATNLVPEGFASLLLRNVGARFPVAVRDAAGQRVQGRTPSISSDGSRLAFLGYAGSSGSEQAVTWDRVTRAVTLLSRNAQGEAATLGLNGPRCTPDPSPCIYTRYTDFNPTISGDGRRVAFASRGPNLVTNDANGDGIDAYSVDLGGPSGSPIPVPLDRKWSVLLAALLSLTAALAMYSRPGDTFPA